MGSVAVKRLEVDFRPLRPKYILVGDILPVGKWLNKRGYQPSKVRESWAMPNGEHRDSD